MFCCLLGRKFSNKCKHSVKCIKCRMETIQKKKQAMVRYLRKDVADLISSGHETNAFGRMDALIVEINQSSCYDMIEQYCCCILEHLPTMQKERVCPEEAVEAIATLIFAAARFPDLPELSDLRNGFTKRYGTQMEAYINEEFVEKMKNKSFPQDKKLQLMQDIAHEFSIHWDLKAFEHEISNPSKPTLDQPETQFSSSNENIKQPVVNKAENLVTSYQASDVQKKQLTSEKLTNTENFKEYQKIIQMRRCEHHPHGSTEKMNKTTADELENTKSRQFKALNVKTEGQNSCERSEIVCEGLSSIGIDRQAADFMAARDAKAANRIPQYTKFARDFKGISTNQEDSTSEVVKEIDHIIQWSQPDRTMNIQRNRTFYLKPPYVKPKLTKNASLNMSNGGNYLMNPPLCADSTVEDANSLDQIQIKQPDTVGKKNSMHGDDNEPHSFVLPLSKQTEDDATNGAINRRRLLQRAFSNHPRHGSMLS